MPDFLTRRHGTWHFVWRVPSEFALYDSRGVIKHSTRIRVRALSSRGHPNASSFFQVCFCERKLQEP
jgi:hypothetical protein